MMHDNPAIANLLRRILSFDEEDMDDILPPKKSRLSDDDEDKPSSSTSSSASDTAVVAAEPKKTNTKNLTVRTRRIISKTTKVITNFEYHYIVTYQKYLYNGKNNSIRILSSSTGTFNTKTPATVHRRRETEIIENLHPDYIHRLLPNRPGVTTCQPIRPPPPPRRYRRPHQH